MKNLLGRLNARSQEDVARIATTWRIAVDGTDKLGMVATVYRALTDIRTIRDVWDALPEDERALIVALDGTPPVPLTIPDLATKLNVAESEIRRRATSLFQKGLVVREGDDAELRVGELPKLFLPREIASLIRRVRAEMAAGDVSNAPLESLLVTLDDVEIEQTADAWGVHVIAGLKSRAELIRQLMNQIDDPLRRETITAKLTGAPAENLASTARQTERRTDRYQRSAGRGGIERTRPRAVHRGRLALAELEDKLLVWHSYGPNGEREVFIPAGILEPGRRAAIDVPAPAPSTLVESNPPPARVIPTRSPGTR